MIPTTLVNSRHVFDSNPCIVALPWAVSAVALACCPVDVVLYGTTLPLYCPTTPRVVRTMVAWVNSVG